jgi:hypothetical protein
MCRVMMASRILVPLLLLLGTAWPVRAQDSTAIRGGWMTDVNGQRHILYLVVRGSALTGVYCIQCERPDGLAFVRDGVWNGSTVRFTLLHQRDGAPAYREIVEGAMMGGELHITKRRQGWKNQSTALRLRRGTRVPFPARAANAPRPPAYVPPGPPEPLTPEAVEGLWLAQTGPTKQYFSFRRVGSELLGLVCGPCDNPMNVSPIDTVSIDGTILRFNIVHEDNGIGFDVYGPFSNIVQATISKHEMHITALPTYDMKAAPIEMTMFGPVAYRRPK